MADNTEDFGADDALRTENEILKLKMMLENGAKFGNLSGGDLPADLENAFLRNVMAFEQQYQQQKTTTVFAKLGKPTHFKAVEDIADADMPAALNELLTFMLEHGVELGVLSPNVPERELYRFATEELFLHELDDMDIPGMMNCFIYDEFYPDYKFDNSRYAVNDCLKLIFCKEHQTFWPWMEKQLRLNNNATMPLDEFSAIINQFKDAHDALELVDAVVEDCVILETECIVTGTYNAEAMVGDDAINYANRWRVVFNFDDDLGYYGIGHVEINGINF